MDRRAKRGLSDVYEDENERNGDDEEVDFTECRSRKWVATLWLHQVYHCLEETMKNLTDTGRIRFIAYGEEVCPKEGTLHYQAYLVFYQPQYMSRCIRLFGTGHHFEPMYGTLEQNENYCKKEGHFTKLGDEPKQGERSDLIGFKRLIDQGKRPVEIAEDNEIHFESFVRYSRSLNEYHHHKRAKKIRCDREMPKVYIRIGESGSGKTKWLDDKFGRDGYARMPEPTGNWWITPEVSHSDTVLIDELGPTKAPKIEELLQWTDRYPIEFNCKGGFLWWKPKNIVITSNCTWEQWWKDPLPEHLKAFERRIFCVMHVYKDRPEQVVYPNDSYAGY